MKLLGCEWAKLNTCKIHLLMAASDTQWVQHWANAVCCEPKSIRIWWLSVKSKLSQKFKFYVRKNKFSISHCEFWGLGSFRHQLSGFMEKWQETLWVLSVLPSCLQPALTRGPLLSLWSPAVSLVPCCHVLATMATSLSPEHVLPPVYRSTGASSEHTG